MVMTRSHRSSVAVALAMMTLATEITGQAMHLSQRGLALRGGEGTVLPKVVARSCSAAVCAD